uniref:Ion_trans_2 domain-containing protein n=1 Tax=Heterorhabditis bacteriophora TaxID=37862 RepID=A0A1I7XHW5_HETBA
MTAFVIALLSLLFAYPITGGIVINQVSDLSLFESIYYCSITILTVGYGDIGPPIPVIYLILFIVVGVTLVTISVDVVAANGIHHVHYMGRQMGKAKIIAGKMIQICLLVAYCFMAQKISINKGLGLGMAQLGAFARMGMMINVSSNGGVITQTTRTEQGSEEMEPLKRKSTAFDPELDFDLIDRGVPIGYDCYENSGFGYFDDLENDAFYT